MQYVSGADRTPVAHAVGGADEPDARLELYGLSGRAVREGNFARLVLLDWKRETVYRSYRSKAANTQYTGMPLTGAPRAIVTGAKVTAR